MATTTAINAIPIPELTDPPHINNSIAPLANQIDTRMVARFSTVSARNTAIPTPTAGMMAWCTDMGELYLYNGTAWVSARPRTVYKTVVEYRSGTTVFSNDNELFITIEPNSTYLMNFMFSYDGSSSSADIKFQWNASAGVTTIAGLGSGGAYYYTTTDLLTLNSFNIDSVQAAGTGSTFNVWRQFIGSHMFKTDGTVTLGETIYLQWAQNSATGDTRIGEGSYIETWKVG